MHDGGTARIAMWSGPRNISTAMVRAWENRVDTIVADEPFYGAYLASTGLDHPMRDAVLARHPTGWSAIARACASDERAPVVYQKHMCQHMIDAAPRDWLSACRHAFLVRPPEEVAASFYKAWPQMTADDLGFRLQAELFDDIRVRTGRAPPVLEARDVLVNPEGMLRALCAALEVPFDRAMLSWPAGRRDTDGAWAAHWYGAVERSTGFAPPRPAAPPPPEVAAVVAECRPYYERLAAHRLTAPPPG